MNAKDILWELIDNKWAPGKQFELNEVYEFESEMLMHYPENTEMKAKIRQLLQQLRDDGFIEFIDNEGTYKKL